MTTLAAMLAQYEQTAPAPVSGLGNVIEHAAATAPVGPVLARLAAGWRGSFADLVVTAADVAEPSPEDALVFEIVLDRLMRQRQEDRFFSGAAAHRADWPIRRALGDAQDALGRWREHRAGCAGCGTTSAGRWALSRSAGIGRTFFLEHWCRECIPHGTTPCVPRAAEKLDFAGLYDAHGKVAVVGSPESGYTLVADPS